MMIKQVTQGIGWIMAVSGLTAQLFAAEPSAAPDFQEVFHLLKTHLQDADTATLNQAAITGLVQQLQPKVTLLPSADAATNEPALPTAKIMEQHYAYFLIRSIPPGTAAEIRNAWDRLAKEATLKGIVLDLRFTQGTDYAAAAHVADLFLAEERPLADWGDGMKKSAAKKDALAMPLAVLVNTETAGAAEMLAGILRESGLGLVLGSTTAGRATEFKEFPLSTGQRLRIATTPIQLGSGKELGTNGLNPDITVAVGPAIERAYLEDPYRRPASLAEAPTGLPATNSAASTNAGSRRINEAELIRLHREGIAPDPAENASPSNNGDPSPPVPILQDPVLARAVDLLKGLAVIRLPRAG